MLRVIQSKVFTQELFFELEETITKVTAAAPKSSILISAGIIEAVLGLFVLIGIGGAKAEIEKAPGPGRAQRHMRRKPVALVGLSGINDHSDEAMFFSGRKRCRPAI